MKVSLLQWQLERVERVEPGTAKSAGGSPISTKMGSASAAFVRRPLTDSDNCAVTRISQLQLRPAGQALNVISRDKACGTFEDQPRHSARW